MSVRETLGRYWLESLAWLVGVPSIIVSIWNADAFRLILGAFGPPPDTTMLRGLALAAALVALAWWQRQVTNRQTTAGRYRIGDLAFATLAIAVVVVIRIREVRRDDVAFQGNGIRIAATLYRPLIPGRYPGVVFVPGSAPFKRGLYALWAEHLARIGIVSLVPDKRGVGGTGGNFERDNNTSNANLTLLAGDAVVSLQFLAHQGEVDSLRLGLFGVSQGGWTAPMAAVASPLARFMVLISGPTVSVHEEGVWSDLRGDDERRATMSRAEAERVIDTVSSRGVDARSSLAALDIPGLWLFGADDASIPAQKSVAVLDSIVRTDRKPFSFDSVPGYGHLVMGRQGSLLPRVAPSSWRAMDDWLARNLKHSR